ncbi:MAG: AarF/UbiB family protein [Bdellovibrionia bacterium]
MILKFKLCRAHILTHAVIFLLTSLSLILGLENGALSFEHQDAGLIRELMSDLIQYSEIKDEEYSPLLMKQAFAKRPELVNILIDSHRLSEALAKNGLDSETISKLKDGLQIVHSLSKALLDSSEKIGMHNAARSQISKHTGRSIDLLNEKPFLQLALFINHFLEHDLKFKNRAELKKLLDPKSGIDLSKLPDELRATCIALLENYFDALPLYFKRKIALAYLALPQEASEEQKLATLLNNCGPGLQKLIQLLAGNTKSEAIKKIVSEMKSNISPMSKEDLSKAKTESFGDNMDQIFGSFNEVPIAAGSVGQAHDAILKDGHKSVVVKLRRYGIEESVFLEYGAFRKIYQKYPKTKEMLESLHQMVREELDFGAESESLEKGKAYDWPDVKLSTVKELNVPNKGANVIILEKARGKNLTSLPQDFDIQCSLKKSLLHLLEAWLYRAFLKDGFFHADLHSGNVFFHPSSSVSEMGELSLIDFGSSAILADFEKEAYVQFISSVVAGSSSLLKEALPKLDPQTTAQQMDQIEIPFAHISEGKGPSVLTAEKEGKTLSDDELFQGKLNDTIDLIANSGIKLPTKFIKFSRGFGLLNELLLATDEKLRKFGDKKCVVDNERAIIKRFVCQYLPEQFFKASVWNGACLKLVGKSAFLVVKDKYSNKRKRDDDSSPHENEHSQSKVKKILEKESNHE